MSIRNFICYCENILFRNKIIKKVTSMLNIPNKLYELDSKIDLILKNKDYLHLLYETHEINSNAAASNICKDYDTGVLDVLCNKYGSDKGITIKINNCNMFPWYPHTYTKVYEMLFKDIRYDVKSVFECGIGTNNENIASNMTSSGKPGASLRMWRDYFQNAIIWGGDIDRDILFSEERIRTGYIDQTSKESIDRFFSDSGIEKFDIIIDDGLHTYEAAASLFDTAFQYLSANGFYIIEDLSVNDIIKFQEHISYLKKKISVKYCMMCTPYSLDNNLVIIRNM